MPDAGAVGPRREQTEGDSPPGFDQIAGALGDGGLLLPAVFGFAASVALAKNADSGQTAEQVFALGLMRSLHYRVHITTLSPDQPQLGEREVVNTVAMGLRPLAALLETLLDEIAELMEGNS